MEKHGGLIWVESEKEKGVGLFSLLVKTFNIPGMEKAFYKRISYWIVCVVFLIGVLALIGWLGDMLSLASIGEHFIPMAPGTAFSFILLSMVSLNFLLKKKNSKLLQIILSLVLVFNLATLFDNLLKYPLGIEGIFGTPDLLHSGVPLGRMSPFTIVLFIISTVSLFIITNSNRRFYKLSIFLCSIGMYVAIVLDLGYLYGTPLLYGYGIIPPALNTSIAFTFLFIGILLGFGMHEMPFKLFVGQTVRARLMRNFLPITLLIIVVAGWMDTLVFHHYNDHIFVSSQVTILSIFILGLSLIKIAKSIGNDIDNVFAFRKVAEEALKESELHFRTLADSGQALIWTSGLNKKCNYFNQPWLEFTGRNLDQELNDGWIEGVHPDDLTDCVETYVSAFDKQERFSMDYRLRYHDQSYRWIQDNGTPRFNSQNEFIGYIGHCLDITDRKDAEENLSHERMMLRTLIDNLPVTIYVKDVQCRKIIANKADLEVIGSKSEDVIGKTDLEIFNNEIGLRGFDDDKMVIDTGVAVLNREEDFIDTDGEQRWLITSKIPLTDKNGNVVGLVGIGRDITAQKQDQEKIIKLSKGIEQSSANIVITDTMGNIEYVNPAFCRTTGYSELEVLGQNPRMLNSGHQPTSFYLDLWQTIGSGNVWSGEMLNKRKDGILYWERATITSIKNDKGIITSYIAIKEDITEQKKMQEELVQAKEKAEESDRLKSAFLANMSHEIRTPLNSIIGFSELLGDPDFEPDEKAEFIKIIVDNGNSLLVIINDIMDFSMLEARQIKIRKEDISTKKILTELLQDFGKKASERGIEIRLDHSSDSPDVVLKNDFYRIKQIFGNLIGNALKFTHKGYIEIGFKTDGDFIEFHVKDTGIGIAPEFHQAIFERFRQVDTAKTRKYGGNGLGLAISKNLVELLGGTIWVESEQDKYSKFFFTIPIHKNSH